MKQLIPPVVLPLARRVTRSLRTPEWSYVGATWPDDDSRAGGWNHPSVVEAQRARWTDFVAAVRSVGPLGVNHEAARTRRYDLVVASNAIQYEPDWRGLLARFAAVADRWVFLTRVPLVDKAASFVVTQRPHHVGYHTEYLGWVFNRDELLAQAASVGLALEREFLMVGERNEGVAGAPEPHDNRGFLFRAKA